MLNNSKNDTQNSQPLANDRLLRVLRGQSVDRMPMWIMRQAGRYLPEYRDVRAKTDFLTLCRTPELAAQVTLQPVDRFDLDAAILFSDIMMPLESMGVEMDFAPGPIVRAPLRDRAAVERLRIPETEAIAPYVMDTVRLLRQHLAGRIPLIGFAGAPLTLAAYLVEGKGSKDFTHLRGMMHADPEAAHLLMQRLGDVVGRYLRQQVLAGAQVIQLFDSWAGILSADMYARFALPAVRHIFAQLDDLHVPRIFFAQDAAALWPVIKDLPVEGFGVDWRMRIADVRAMVGPHVALQGNMDPAVLYASPNVIRTQAQQIIEETAGLPHIFNLGHGIQPDTPVDSVYALVEAVHGAR